MKIVLCCRVYPTHRPGGMPFVVQDRARALAKLGHEVHVLTTSVNGTPSVDPEVTVKYLDCPSQVYSQGYATACLDYCRKLSPEVVHSDSMDVNMPWWGDLPKTIKTSCTMHGFSWGAFFTQWNLYRINRRVKPLVFNQVKFLFERNALATFGTVIGVSIHEHWMLRDLMGLSGAKLVYNPIPGYFFSTAPPLPPKVKRFLCASITGQDTRMFDVATEAAKLAKVELVTVSSEPREAMPKIYDSVCATVIPTTYSQGYDLTVAESTARGRPVLASATGSYLREAEYNKGISLFPMGDVKALAELMRSDLPVVTCGDYQHRPEVHAERWLEAVCG